MSGRYTYSTYYRSLQEMTKLFLLNDSVKNMISKTMYVFQR